MRREQTTPASRAEDNGWGTVTALRTRGATQRRSSGTPAAGRSGGRRCPVAEGGGRAARSASPRRRLPAGHSASHRRLVRQRAGRRLPHRRLPRALPRTVPRRPLPLRHRSLQRLCVLDPAARPVAAANHQLGLLHSRRRRNHAATLPRLRTLRCLCLHLRLLRRLPRLPRLRRLRRLRRLSRLPCLPRLRRERRPHAREQTRDREVLLLQPRADRQQRVSAEQHARKSARAASGLPPRKPARVRLSEPALAPRAAAGPPEPPLRPSPLRDGAGRAKEWSGALGYRADPRRPLPRRRRQSRGGVHGARRPGAFAGWEGNAVGTRRGAATRRVLPGQLVVGVGDWRCAGRDESRHPCRRPLRRCFPAALLLGRWTLPRGWLRRGLAEAELFQALVVPPNVLEALPLIRGERRSGAFHPHARFSPRGVCVCVCEGAIATAMSAGCRLVLSPRWRRGLVPRLPAHLWARGGSPRRL